MVARVVAAFQLEDDGKLLFFFCDEVSVSISDSKQMHIIFFTHAHDYYHMCLLFLIPARCDHFLQIGRVGSPGIYIQVLFGCCFQDFLLTYPLAR